MTQKRMQFNFRTNLELEMLIDKLMRCTGKRKTELIQEAIYSYAKNVLSEEDFNGCVLRAAHERILKKAK